MNSICCVKDLRFAYKKDKIILSGVSFSAAANEIIGIIGKNGSGKSTLLNIIVGFIKGYDGNVFINNEDAKILTLKERAKTISYIPQKKIAIPDYYTVEDFVMEGCRPFRNLGLYKPEDYKNMDKILADCKLTAFKNKLISELSGGEMQRCIFARAIMKNAKLFLFDEPNSALDIKYQKDFFDLAKKLKNAGGAVLIAVHDINLAVRYCDRLLVLSDGTVLYNGDAAAVNEDILSRAFDVEVFTVPQTNKNFYY